MTDARTVSVPRSLEIYIRVRFGDTDPYGVVYFVSYFRYFHRGIEEFLRSRGLAPEKTFRNPEEGYGLPIAGASCDFYRPVWYGAELGLLVFVEKIKPKSLTFGFQFYPADGRDLIAQGRATMVAIDRTWKSRVVPEGLLKVLEADPATPSNS